ncbi:hypothetical protein BJ322DRAFT_339784 [Thelephora terrestris]|uniref:DUF6533 domain-containing protein n=1 Tax=Thelephora terrestris TaxID=56493 RepID=A0A9P6H619_9AGAM|nr:hypothetical protein BJ322DRAFT_339784 [Thelephora terrestris]
MAGELAVDSFHLFNRNRATVVSILALCAYEYIITLYDEIRYVWKHKYTFATFLFAFNRYAVWVETCFLLYLAFGDLTTNDVNVRVRKERFRYSLCAISSASDCFVQFDYMLSGIASGMFSGLSCCCMLHSRRCSSPRMFYLNMYPSDLRSTDVR